MLLTYTHSSKFKCSQGRKLTAEKIITHLKRAVPSQMCLNATAAAAAESSDLSMPLRRTFMNEDNSGNPSVAASSHLEYAPIVKHTEIFSIT